MVIESTVAEYKCPCCNAGLVYSGDVKQLTCPYCDNSFELDAVMAFNEPEDPTPESFSWEEGQESQTWSEEEQQSMQAFLCPSCGGEILTDENTAATFCPYCANPTILPGRVSGGLKPDGVIPFTTGKEDAKAAFLNLCKGKPLLPKFFTEEQQLEKITGIYVPFWLYDCSGNLDGTYRATRIHHWSDAHYNYTRTEHYLLKRNCDASFAGIPMDGSSKMDDTFMESIEPYDYGRIEDFDMAYLSGFLADKYDIFSKAGEDRIRTRVGNSLEDMVSSTFLGYSSVIPTHKRTNIRQGKVRYVLMPVWLLNTRYRDKLYTFAMNGQTGKIAGTIPICPKRTALWFSSLAAAFTAVSLLLMALL